MGQTSAGHRDLWRPGCHASSPGSPIRTIAPHPFASAPWHLTYLALRRIRPCVCVCCGMCWLSRNRGQMANGGRGGTRGGDFPESVCFLLVFCWEAADEKKRILVGIFALRRLGAVRDRNRCGWRHALRVRHVGRSCDILSRPRSPTDVQRPYSRWQGSRGVSEKGRCPFFP